MYQCITWLCVASLFLLAAPTWAGPTGQQIADEIDQASYTHYLDNELFTRDKANRGLTGAEHDACRDNVLAILQSFGLTAELHAFSYQGQTYYNVVGTQIGTVYPDAQYVVGGHYDSVENPGADDDASGVAGVLEIARVFSMYQTEYTIKYIAFDREEQGLVGSQAYASDHWNDDIRGMIQLDMIAYDNGNYHCDIFGRSQSNPLKNDLRDAINEYGNGLTVTVGGASGNSDHAPFEWQGWEACLLIEDWGNPCYHTACDTVDNPNYIAYEYATNMVRSTGGLLAERAGLDPDSRDCDRNGTIDLQEILADPSLDCNENGWLDMCEEGYDQDCNDTGLPDFCDIYSGASNDCNLNGIPDECEPDCNENGIADECDIADGTSFDVNLNGIPDECEPYEAIYVDASNLPGPGSGTPEDPFLKIQDALDSASDGLSEVVEIFVADGVYTGEGNRDLNFAGKRIYLHSVNGPANCIIDCQNVGAGFYLNTDEGYGTIIEGLTIRNAADTGIYLWTASPLVHNCIIEANFGTFGGGVTCVASDVRFTDCIIRNNTGTSGGAIYLLRNNPSFTNCRIVNNHAANAFGGGLYTVLCAGTFDNCIFTGNDAVLFGGAVYCDSDGPTLRNCILWGNTAQLGHELYLAKEAEYPLTVTYCDVQGGFGDVVLESGYTTINWGAGNIDAYPGFVGGYYLRQIAAAQGEDSPCVDAGDPASELIDGTTRTDGVPDIGVVDIGFHYAGPACLGDINGDGQRDFTDFTTFSGAYGSQLGDAAFSYHADLNGDESIDFTDFTVFSDGWQVACP